MTEKMFRNLVALPAGNEERAVPLRAAPSVLDEPSRVSCYEMVVARNRVTNALDNQRGHVPALLQ